MFVKRPIWSGTGAVWFGGSGRPFSGRHGALVRGPVPFVVAGRSGTPAQGRGDGNVGGYPERVLPSMAGGAIAYGYGDEARSISSLGSSPRTRSGVHRAAREWSNRAFLLAAEWTPEQVRGDGAVWNVRDLHLRPYLIPPGVGLSPMAVCMLRTVFQNHPVTPALRWGPASSDGAEKRDAGSSSA